MWKELNYDSCIEDKCKETQTIIYLNNKLRAKLNINLNQPLGLVTFFGVKFLDDGELNLLSKSLGFKSFEKRYVSQDNFVVKPNNKLIGTNYKSEAQAIIKAIKQDQYNIDKNGFMAVCNLVLDQDYYEVKFKESDDFVFKDYIGFKFDKTITDDLRDEFLYKEFKKAVSSYRKNKGCKVQDTVTINVCCSDRFKNIINKINKKSSTIINFVDEVYEYRFIIDGEDIYIWSN